VYVYFAEQIIDLPNSQAGLFQKDETCLSPTLRQQQHH
jgi:hypothetical protein